MNKTVFKEIFDNYKGKYDFLNDPDGRNEIYKWPAVRCCIDNWEIDADDFLDMFKRSMRLSQNIIENRYKHPINGIVFLCEQGKTDQVREAFRKLLSDEEDIRKVQSNADTFQDEINAMLGEIAPEKWSYEQDRRDPLMYLAFIRPGSCYMFKAESARVFANYVEFGDDIGSGQTFRLDNYYRLCDEVLAEVEDDVEFVEMLDDKLTMAAEKNDMDAADLQDIPGKLKIVVYDIMYCANSAWLYEGMPEPVKKGSKQDKERTRHKRIEEIHDQLDKENAELDALLKDVPEYPDLVGAELTNIRYGKGIVKSQAGHYLHIEYNGDEKTFPLPDCITKGYLKGADDSVVDVCKRLSEIDAEKKRLTGSLRRLSEELSLLE
ncbi:MAG: hypothetical protein E7298_13670 [Lachnospiraceae bacterium]|nr:hypothetical protein [Lachnospiraceae bacterium]